MESFKNKIVLVTGGTTGIGRATAVAYAKAGAKVVVAGRRVEEGNETVKQIQKAGSEGLFVKTDITKEADVKALVDQTIKTFGRLDIAFNNAGVETLGPITDATPEQFHQVFDVNVLGVILSLKYEIPAMLKTGGGSIVNTSSIAGFIGMANVSLYVATKHAVIGLTKATALEYAKQNIRVNGVAPAAIESEMFTRFAGEPGSEGRKFMAGLHPVGRIGTGDEVAAAVMFLSSDKASFITGQTLGVDGGFTAQ